jgi:regulator of RNase E activity RraA
MLLPCHRQPLLLFKIFTLSLVFVPFGVRFKPISIKGFVFWGAVTNGSFRDVPDSAIGFNLIVGKVGPSHAFVHLVDIDCQVMAFGLTAKTNDIIHAYKHGAALIPPAAVKQISKVVVLISRREKIILEAAKFIDFMIAKLKTAMGQMEDIH